MGRAHDDLKRLGATALAIAPGGPRMARASGALLNLPFPLLHDGKAVTFERYGFDKKLYVIRESGTVLVDREGRIAYLTRSANPMASLDLAELLRAAQTL